MQVKYIYLMAILVVIGAALALRVPGLDRKPMHGDEANQAVRAGMLMDSGVYQYDPTDHHGPVMYFAAMPFCHATAENFAGTNEWNYRLVTVIFSVLTLVLMIGFGHDKAAGGLFCNRVGLLFALLFTALSPAMNYYSRFFIQESMLVCFLTGMFVTGSGYVRARALRESASKRRRLYNPAVMAALFGVFTGLCLATKETTVLSFAAMFAAALSVFGLRRLLCYWSTRDLLIAIGAAVAVAVLFFTSFFTYFQGLYDALFATVEAYAVRATKVPEHHHPWNFYLKTIFWFKYGRGPIWSEAGILLPAALAFGCAFFTRRADREKEISGHGRFVRFMFVYTLLLTILYALIPYKTPWCALSFLHGWIILGGVGAGYAFDFARHCSRRYIRLSCGLLLVAVSVALTGLHTQQSIRACFKYAADPRNPYVYAHTGRDAMNLVAEIEEAAAAAQGYDTFIVVALPTSDTWPLPWYLRKYSQVGYWTDINQVPAAAQPVVIVASASQGDLAAERFGKNMQCNFYGIRPGTLVNLFVPEKDD